MPQLVVKLFAEAPTRTSSPKRPDPPRPDMDGAGSFDKALQQAKPARKAAANQTQGARERSESQKTPDNSDQIQQTDQQQPAAAVQDAQPDRPESSSQSQQPLSSEDEPIRQDSQPRSRQSQSNEHPDVAVANDVQIDPLQLAQTTMAVATELAGQLPPAVEPTLAEQHSTEQQKDQPVLKEADTVQPTVVRPLIGETMNLTRMPVQTGEIEQPPLQKQPIAQMEKPGTEPVLPEQQAAIPCAGNTGQISQPQVLVPEQLEHDVLAASQARTFPAPSPKEQLPATVVKLPSPQQKSDSGPPPTQQAQPQQVLSIGQPPDAPFSPQPETGQQDGQNVPQKQPQTQPSASQSGSTPQATDLLGVAKTLEPKTTESQTAAPQPPTPSRPETEFSENNHQRIITSIRSQLMPNGGTMRLRLEPPELGSLHVTVRVSDGVMTASFETTSDQATRLLSHSLGQLKQALETQGLSVEKLHVQQLPRDPQNNSASDDQQQRSWQDDSESRRQQQRRELLQRMWRRLRLGHDPLDLVA